MERKIGDYGEIGKKEYYTIWKWRGKENWEDKKIKRRNEWRQKQMEEKGRKENKK